MSEVTATILLGGVTVKHVSQQVDGLSMVIRGGAGADISELGYTALGKKLWVQFDPLGTASLIERDDHCALLTSAIPSPPFLWSCSSQRRAWV